MSSAEGRASHGSGWQARCSGCNKFGDYVVRPKQSSSSQKRYRQHYVNNKYCGRFKVDPQQVPQSEREEGQKPPAKLASSSTPSPAEKIESKEEDSYMVANCTGCGEVGEYWHRVYRDHDYYRLHLVLSGKGGPVAGKFCGNFSENPRWVKAAAGSGLSHLAGVGPSTAAASNKIAPPDEHPLLPAPPSSASPSAAARKGKSASPEVSPPSSAAGQEQDPHGDPSDTSSPSDSSEEEGDVHLCGSCGREFVSEQRLADHQRRSVQCMQQDKRSIRRYSREAAIWGLDTAPLPSSSSSSPSQLDSTTVKTEPQTASTATDEGKEGSSTVEAIESTMSSTSEKALLGENSDTKPNGGNAGGAASTYAATSTPAPTITSSSSSSTLLSPSGVGGGDSSAMLPPSGAAGSGSSGSAGATSVHDRNSRDQLRESDLMRDRDRQSGHDCDTHKEKSSSAPLSTSLFHPPAESARPAKPASLGRGEGAGGGGASSRHSQDKLIASPAPAPPRNLIGKRPLKADPGNCSGAGFGAQTSPKKSSWSLNLDDLNNKRKFYTVGNEQQTAHQYQQASSHHTSQHMPSSASDRRPFRKSRFSD